MSPRLSPRMPWYDGPALLPCLEAVEPRAARPLDAFRMPVQQVIREGGARFYAGMIAERRGAARRRGRHRARRHAAPRSRGSRPWTAISTEAEAGQSVALELHRRGRLLARRHASPPATPPQVADQFEADLIWMAEEPLLPGRQYLLKLGTQTVPATVQEPKYKIGIDTMEQLAAQDAGAERDRRRRHPHRAADRRSSPMRRAGRSAASS